MVNERTILMRLNRRLKGTGLELTDVRHLFILDGIEYDSWLRDGGDQPAEYSSEIRRLIDRMGRVEKQVDGNSGALVALKAAIANLGSGGIDDLVKLKKAINFRITNLKDRVVDLEDKIKDPWKSLRKLHKQMGRVEDVLGVEL